MKVLTLIVRETAAQDLVDLLLCDEQISGFTTFSGEGHSCSTRENPFENDADRVLGYVPRVKVEILLEDEAVEHVLDRLRQCESCVAGQGIWWVTPVTDSGKL
jgi:nitrogen regulatory protein P-II 1